MIEVLATYNNWDVIEIDPKHSRRWLCRCRCENQTTKWCDRENIKRGRSKSCGCLRGRGPQREYGNEGLADHPLYRTWSRMIERCYNENHIHYKSYGGRGITVCAQWLEKDGCKQFIADMGPKPTPKHKLDRRENNEGYGPDNCLWSTMTEQNRNKRTNHNLTHDGRTQCISAWAEETGIRKDTIRSRISLGWTASEAVTTPIGSVRRRREPTTAPADAISLVPQKLAKAEADLLRALRG